MEFTIRHDGREFAPYSEAEVKNRLSAGTLAPSDLALAPGANEWAQLSTFPQFLPIDSTSPLRPQQLGAYTAATLQPDERPLHQTHIHWIALSGSVIGALLCLIFLVPIVRHHRRAIAVPRLDPTSANEFRETLRLLRHCEANDLISLAIVSP